MIFFLLLFAAVLVGHAAFFIYLQDSFWQRLGIIGPKGLPVVGNMLQFFLGRKHYGEVYKQIYDSFPNLPYIGIYGFLNEPTVLLRDQESIKDIMIKNFQNFQDNVLWVDPKRDPMIPLNPFVAKGDKWKQRRSEIVPIFTPNKVKSAFSHIKAVCKNLDDYVANEMDRSCFEAKDLFSKYTLAVVASAAFGLDAQTFTKADSDFTTLAENVFLPNSWSLLNTTALLFSPTLGKLMKFHYVPRNVQDWLTAIVGRVLDKRLDACNKPRPGSNASDFIQHLIEAKARANEPVDRSSIIGHCGTFLFEGFETSSSLMAFALYEYAANLQVQQRVLQEIDTVLARNNGEMSYEALQDMPYLESSLYETLRLHPAMTALLKHCTKQFTLKPQTPSGIRFVVEEGMAFVVPVIAIHTDPEIYPEPYKFQPERFLGQNEKQRLGCTFLGFGEGPRMCPGSRFGLTQSKAGLVTLLAKYSVHLAQASEKPLEISPTNFLLASKNGIWLQFRLRK